jgi:hypothetical protein
MPPRTVRACTGCGPFGAHRERTAGEAEVVAVWARDAEQAFVTVYPVWEYGKDDTLNLPIPTSNMSMWAAHIGEDVELAEKVAAVRAAS